MRIVAAAAAALLSLALAGCGTLSVSTRSGDGGAVAVGIGKPTPSATSSPAPKAPPGSVFKTLTFDKCPVEVRIPVPQDWNVPQPYDDYYAIPKPGGSYPYQAIVDVQCRLQESDTPNEVTENTRGYVAGQQEYSIERERRGTLKGESFWIYHAETDGEEIKRLAGPAIDYGLVMGIPANGRTYQLDVSFRTIKEDQELSALFEKSIEVTSVNGRTFDLPEG